MKNATSMLLRKQLLLLPLFICLLCQQTNAQHLLLGDDETKVEAGLNFGPTFFLGDLGGNVGKGTPLLKDLNLKLTKLMKGAFVSVYPSTWWGMRLAGQYTYVEGQDKIIKTFGVDELWRKQRNLDFKSNMWELYGALEFFPLEFINRNDGEYDPRFKPYAFGGLGVFHFNPKGSLTDQAGNVTWHELQPLSTEGQGFPQYPGKKKYNLTQLNIPFGGGFKYIVSDNVNIGLELLYRKTFTDYIDDVSTVYIDRNYFALNLSAADAAIANQIADKTIGIVTPGRTRYAPGDQRGNSNNKDAYFSLALKIGIRFGGGQYGSSGGGGNGSSYNRNASSRVRCPRF